MFRLSKGRLRFSLVPRMVWRHHRPAAALSTRARSVLGENGEARYAEFRQYRRGWASGQGRELTPASVAALELFLAAHGPFATRPSLFMTEAGNLELAWESRTGGRMEIEFCADGFHYFIESEHGADEGVVALSCLPSLIARLEQEESPNR